MKTYVKDHWSLVLAAVLFPFLLWGAVVILPTFDDWTSLVTPSFEPFFTKERFLFYGYHWRPFDSMFGWLVGRQPQLLFPTLNHFCVVTGHLLCTTLVFQLAKTLEISPRARNIATAFFFLTPGMLATVLAVDGLNQTYTLFWGMLAAWVYLTRQGKQKYVGWLLLVFIATLCKENGLMWALIAPILAYGFGITSFPILKRDLLVGSSLIALYALAVLLLPSHITIHPEYVPGIGKSVADVAKFLLTTWVAVDFVSLLHQPSRNLLVAVVTLLLSLPMMVSLAVYAVRHVKNRKFLCLVICHLIAVAPHILTVFSMMHTYAGLSLAALLIGIMTEDMLTTRRKLLLTAIPFALAAFFVDAHLWYASYQSGLVGKRMAQQVISKTDTPPDNVHLIIIEDDYPRLSSFCVIPSDAFGWGAAVLYETHYQWPENLTDTIIPRSDHAVATARMMGIHALLTDTVDAVWIVNHDDVEVIEMEN